MEFPNPESSQASFSFSFFLLTREIGIRTEIKVLGKKSSFSLLFVHCLMLHQPDWWLLFQCKNNPWLGT